MGKRQRPDLDEKFSLHPLTGEQVARRLLGVTEDDQEQVDEDDGSTD